jgi:hypothetical protein
MLAVMSVWFPILGHPIPKACAISALLRTENEVPTFSWVASPASNDAKSDSVRPTDHLAQGPTLSWRCNARAAAQGDPEPGDCHESAPTSKLYCNIGIARLGTNSRAKPISTGTHAQATFQAEWRAELSSNCMTDCAVRRPRFKQGRPCGRSEDGAEHQPLRADPL